MATNWRLPTCLCAIGCLVALLYPTAVPKSTAMVADEELSLMQTHTQVHKRAKTSSRVAPGTASRSRRPPLVLAHQAPNSTTNATGAADATGVTLNGAGDLEAFISGTISYSIACCVFVAFFMWASRRFPMMYSNNVKIGIAPGNIPTGMFGWARASLNTKIPEYADKIGLDMAMLLEYSQLCMRILTVIGIPMCCIFGPLNYIFGGFAAGDDYMSYFSFGNVQNGKWHYFMYAFVVWYVVFVVQYFVFQAQQKFVQLRYDWLKKLSDPRASTILVENIPEQYQSDAMLKTFFEKLFSDGAVKSAFVVKDTTTVLAAETKQECIAQKLNEALAVSEENPAIGPLEEELETAKASVAEERAKVMKQAEAVGGVNLCSGFVTFKSRRDALVAENLTFGRSYDEIVVSVPPPEGSVIWNDLKSGTNKSFGFTLLGYGLVIGLYIGYLPLTIWMTSLATNFNMGPLQPLWESVAPTMGIQIMVAFLPTILLLIFRFCFVLKDDAWSQLRLQNWYFVFQVVFVVLIVAISSNVWEFTEMIFTDPTSVPMLLGQTMPSATHFYMNFMVLQWMTHSMNLTRYIQLIKYDLFSSVFTDKEKARAMSEPEDQDYYGIGSRSARWSTTMLVCIIFGTLCPWMSLLGFINFFLCRMYYGYLIGFAETKKPDLGGLFWVQKLRNLFLGLVIYVVMMTGVIYARASSGTPAIISALSIVFVVLRFRRFEEAFVWERLPFEIVSRESLDKKHDDGKYVQPELLDPEERENYESRVGLMSAFTTFARVQRARRNPVKQ